MLRSGDTILFQGDSITNAHRIADPREPHDCYQLGSGYALMVAATLRLQRPGERLRFLNRGVCGEGVGGLAARWDRDCIALQPSVISILVGVNDADPEDVDGPARFADTYRALLARTRRELPEARLVLLEPFGVRVPPAGQWYGLMNDEWLARVRTLQPAVRQLAADSGARFVSLQPLFDAALAHAAPDYWALDGIHPSAAGHALIARAWLQAVTGETVGEELAASAGSRTLA
jgi:lysophospholipase L1-like esterase